MEKAREGGGRAPHALIVGPRGQDGKERVPKRDHAREEYQISKS
jgi:hypothetical protein